MYLRQVRYLSFVGIVVVVSPGTQVVGGFLSYLIRMPGMRSFVWSSAVSCVSCCGNFFLLYFLGLVYSIVFAKVCFDLWISAGLKKVVSTLPMVIISSKTMAEKTKITTKKWRNLYLILLHLKFLKIYENKKVTENADNSNAKGFTYVVSCAKKNRYSLVYV